nr:MAG TPA: hypothetical protein [Caudoviricetes sp.]
MNITKHALQRYARRFKGVEFHDISQVIINNKEQYEIELNKMFDNAIEIYTGRFNGNNGEVKYFLVDNIIMVVDLAVTKVITLYRIEFGFERTIDKTILISLMEQLDEAENVYIKAMDNVKEKKAELDYQKLSLEEEIESLEQTLEAMKSGLSGLEEARKSIVVEEEKARIERDRIAKRIVYSIDYRKSMEEIIND